MMSRPFPPRGVQHVTGDAPLATATGIAAFAPGGIGNIGPGLDVLGCAVTGPGDLVYAAWDERPGVTVLDAGHPELPTDPERHSSAIAAAAVLAEARRRGVDLPAPGITIRLTKGLALAAGQGGSAASAVAGAVAADALCASALEPYAILAAALAAEERVAGRHLDNLAPALLGGIVLVRSIEPVDVVRLPVPPTLTFVLAHPEQRLRTAEARAVLPKELPLSLALRQMAQVSAMVAALYEGDLPLFGRALDDRIAEPARASLLPGFADAKRAALAAGALGASISGAGPTAFAVTDGADAADAVARAMREAYERRGIRCETRVCSVDTRGARLVEAA